MLSFNVYIMNWLTHIDYNLLVWSFELNKHDYRYRFDMNSLNQLFYIF